MTDAPSKITTPADLERYGLEKARMHLDAGWLGQIFGSSVNAPGNIAGVVACVLVLPVALLAFFQGKASVLDYVQAVGPFVTLTLGYLFGRRTSTSGGA